MSPKSSVLALLGGAVLLFGYGAPADAASGGHGQGAAGAITHVWANDGADKVTRDELRAHTAPSSVVNSHWDGARVQLFGARNEVVPFNLVLEAPEAAAKRVRVSFTRLTGPGGYSISSETASKDGLFDWTSRPIELFYVRYLQIRGLSTFGWETYDERHVPEDMRRPWSGPYGEALPGTVWQDRPNHDKEYPDIAVPLELHRGFDIAAQSNQSIWADIYVPKDAPAGQYRGVVKVSEGSKVVAKVPVMLQVRDFELPDEPAAKAMLFLGYAEVNKRYFGEKWPNGNMADEVTALRDKHFMLAHRHKVSLIDANNTASPWSQDAPVPEWWPRLDGTLFTPTNGYDGPGVGTPNDIFSIGTYGSWDWKDEGEAGMWLHTDNWASWFLDFAPEVEYFLYLIDEAGSDPNTELWASWVKSNPGVGSTVVSMATEPLPMAVDLHPSLDAPTSTISVGDPAVWGPASKLYSEGADKRLYYYNGGRPASGVYATEDDGVGLRVNPWAQYKHGIDRWFYWESTYYCFGCEFNAAGAVDTNVFQTAKTFGSFDYVDAVRGEAGDRYTNGDGVLFYPGTDHIYPEESYDVDGPLASLRLKHMRRGIQDVDYLTLAAKVDPARVQEIVDEIIPKVLWEVGVDNLADPTYKHTDISWSNDPDVWNAARAELADIIEGK